MQKKSQYRVDQPLTEPQLMKKKFHVVVHSSEEPKHKKGHFGNFFTTNVVFSFHLCGILKKQNQQNWPYQHIIYFKLRPFF